MLPKHTNSTETFPVLDAPEFVASPILHHDVCERSILSCAESCVGNETTCYSKGPVLAVFPELV